MAKNIKKALKDFWYGKPHTAEEGGREHRQNDAQDRFLLHGLRIGLISRVYRFSAASTALK